MYHGPNPKSRRKLAFQLAVTNEKKIPNLWNEKLTAGIQWFSGFMKRRRELPIIQRHFGLDLRVLINL